MKEPSGDAIETRLVSGKDFRNLRLVKVKWLSSVAEMASSVLMRATKSDVTVMALVNGKNSPLNASEIVHRCKMK